MWELSKHRLCHENSMHHICFRLPTRCCFFPGQLHASWRHQLQHDIRYISFMARSTSFRGIPSRVAAVAFLVSTLHWNDPNPGGRLGGQNSHNGWTTRNILKKYQTVVGSTVAHSWNDHHILSTVVACCVAMAVKKIPGESYVLVIFFSPWFS